MQTRSWTRRPHHHRTLQVLPYLLLVFLAACGNAAAAPAIERSEADIAAPAAPAPRVALVTGSTRGLGQAGGMGYHVIVHGRDEARGLAVVAGIEAAGGSAEFRRADFLELRQVRELAESILADFAELHLLVNNAGIGSAETENRLTVDGIEPVFQVNYLAHYLLTDALLPLLVAGAPARIVNVSSAAQAPIDFDDVMLERWQPDGSEIGRPYAQSKLAQILHTFDLAESLADRGVTVNALHPATFMDTHMVRRAGIEPRATVAEGADAVMQLITDDVGSGQYFRDGQPARAHEQAYDPDARRRLRELSAALLQTAR